MTRQPLDPSLLRSEPAELEAQLPQELTDRRQFIAKVKGMLVGVEYEWAEDTLRGMLYTAERRGIITDRMKDAVQRIADKPTRGSDRGRKGGW